MNILAAKIAIARMKGRSRGPAEQRAMFAKMGSSGSLQAKGPDGKRTGEKLPAKGKPKPKKKGPTPAELKKLKDDYETAMSEADNIGGFLVTPAIVAKREAARKKIDETYDKFNKAMIEAGFPQGASVANFNEIMREYFRTQGRTWSG